MKKVRVLNSVDYAAADYTSASEIILQHALQHRSFGVFCMPVHGLVLACSDHPLSQAAMKADLIVPDGHPVRWLMNSMYHTNLKDRVYGPTLTLHVLEKANRHGLNVFLYGGNTEDTLNKFATFIREQYPNVTICGTYRETDPRHNTLKYDHVNQLGAHIVLIGRGCPAQELWIAEQKDKINAVMMGVGAAFSFHAGVTKQAPRWMQDNGLEWLFRLLSEPKRLWKRYALTNSQFILLVAKEFVRTKILKSQRHNHPQIN